jgi:hypothetical protein
MSSAYILFLSEEDRIRGFGTLARCARISSLPERVYQVPVEALQLLEDQQIKYRRATDAEVKAANDQVRNPVAPVL